MDVKSKHQTQHTPFHLKILCETKINLIFSRFKKITFTRREFPNAPSSSPICLYALAAISNGGLATAKIGKPPPLSSQAKEPKLTYDNYAHRSRPE